MANSTLTSMNSVLMIGVTGLYDTAVQLQGFSADDMYEVDPVDTAEVVMGVDGTMSAGWVPQIKTMKVTLQGDSLSNWFFEAWYAAQEAAQDLYFAFGTAVQPGVGREYTLTRGALSNYSPLSGAKKMLQPRSFQIKWNTVIGSPI